MSGRTLTTRTTLTLRHARSNSRILERAESAQLHGVDQVVASIRTTKLKEPVDARPGPAQAALEGALKLSCSYYGGDPQAAEAARLLRMPGSTNSKRGTPIPVEATAISDRTYELSELIEFWSEAQPLLPSPKKEKKVNGF